MNKFVLLLLIIIYNNSIFAFNVARASLRSRNIAYVADPDFDDDLKKSNGSEYHLGVQKKEKELSDNINSENINKKFDSEMTYFLLAASLGSTDLLQKSIKLGANIFDLDEHKKNAIDVLKAEKAKLDLLDIDSITRRFYIERFYASYGYLKYVFCLYNNLKQSLNKKVNSSEKVEIYNNFDENIFKLIFQYLINDMQIVYLDSKVLIKNEKENHWIDVSDLCDTQRQKSSDFCFIL